MTHSMRLATKARTAGIVASIFSMVLAFAVPSLATTIVVTTTSDPVPSTHNGTCSIRQAIIAANTNAVVDACPAGVAGEDTIQLPAGTYKLSIAQTNDNADYSTGDLDVTEDLVIKGSGAAGTIVQQSPGLDRVLEIHAGNVFVSDLTIQGGYVLAPAQTFGWGGAILNDGTLTLTNAAVKDSYAKSGAERSSYGGGIYSSGDLTIDRTTVSGNEVVGGDSAICGSPGGDGQGGGVAISAIARLTVTQSTITSNSATGGVAGPCGGTSYTSYGGHGDGGGLFVGTVGNGSTITDSTISLNLAEGGEAGSWLAIASPALVGTAGSAHGGGLYFLGTELAVKRSTITSNVARGRSTQKATSGGVAQGGGLHNNGGTLTVENTTFVGNQVIGGDGGPCIPSGLARSGGAASGGAASFYGPTEFSYVTFAGNSAAGGKGGYGDFNLCSNHGTGGDARGGSAWPALFVSNTGHVANSIIAGGSIVAGAGGDGLDGGAPGVASGINCFSQSPNHPWSSLGGNVESGGNTCKFVTPADQVDVTASALGLSPLAANGGSTSTLEISATSVALNFGKAPCPATDQRQVARPQQGACDTGAYERRAGCAASIVALNAHHRLAALDLAGAAIPLVAPFMAWVGRRRRVLRRCG